MTRETADRAGTQTEIQDELDALFRLDDEDAGELLLIRHAQPAASLTHDTHGVTSDPMLSCEGLRQAERLADRLCNLWVDALYSAPERRCFQTAKVIADLLQRPLSIVDGLADIDFNPDQARGGPSVYAERFSRDPRWESLPGFAPGKEFRRRAVAAIDGVIAAHPTRRCLVVTHSALLNAYLSMLLCIPRDRFFAPDHASLSTVRHRGDMCALRTLNDTSHLGLPDPIPKLPAALTPRSLPLTNR
jgi:2,3-bisphosphoglycerate-dependent phosphoglycerate mutase